MKSAGKCRFVSLLVVLLFAAGGVFAGGAPEAAKPQTGTQAPAKQLVLKLGHIDSPTSPMGKGADKFKELVEAKSNGAIRVDVFPSEQLGKGPEMVEDIVQGALELYLENPGTFDQYVPAQKIHFVSYYFRGRQHLRNCMKSDVWQEVFIKPMEAAGIKTLGTAWNWDRGPIRCLIATKPVYTPDDLKDVKMRLWSSDVAIRLWKHMGASPIVMAWGELYLGLKTGTVNCATSPGDGLWPNKLTEVAKYVTLLDEIVQTVNIHMNKKLFDTLPADQQKLLIDCANEAGAYYTSLVNGNWQKEVQLMIKEHGATFLTVDLKPWVQKAQPMIHVFEDEGLLPKGLYDRFQAIPD